MTPTVCQLARAGSFAATGTATGWQVFQSVMWGVWGKPVSPLEPLALLGALVLCGGAAASVVSRRPGVALSAVGGALLWSFYAPAVGRTAHAVWCQPAGANPRLVLDPLALAPVGLLAVTTIVLAGTALFRRAPTRAIPVAPD